jgi:hypothetical protein
MPENALAVHLYSDSASVSIHSSISQAAPALLQSA